MLRIIMMMMMLIVGVTCDILHGCTSTSSTLSCRRIDISTDLKFPDIQKIYVKELTGFSTSVGSFPKLEYLIAEKSRVSCLELLEILPDVKVTINGKKCEQVI